MQDSVEQPLAAMVKKLREAFSALISIYRFGSHGTKYERPDSGLDLAVYAGMPLPAPALWSVAQELAADIGRDVDLVDLASSFDRDAGPNGTQRRTYLPY